MFHLREPARREDRAPVPRAGEVPRVAEVRTLEGQQREQFRHLPARAAGWGPGFRSRY